MKQRRLKVCLVWPWGFERDRIVPLALGYLKAAVDPERYDVHLVDNSFSDRRHDDPAFLEEVRRLAPDLIGVSAWTSTAAEALATVSTLKTALPEVPIVFGGIHATSYPQQVIAHPGVDFVLRGEAERAFPLFLDRWAEGGTDFSAVPGLMWRAGETVHQVPPEYPEALDALPWPDYRFMNLEGYLAGGYRYKTPSRRSAPIWVTRGCPYRCTFCAAPQLNGQPLRRHSVEYMAELIQSLYHDHGIRWFSIIDDNFTLHVPYAKAFCRKMIELGLPGIGFGTPNGIRMKKGDPELWRLMKQAGWQFLVIAPESGSQYTVELMKKDLDLSIVPSVVKDIKAAGLKVHAFFIVGYPGERPEDLALTARKIREWDIDFPVLGHFQPLPGTPIYDELVASGAIEDGLMPGVAVAGDLPYRTPDLEGFNTNWWTLKVYLSLIARRPSVLSEALSFYAFRTLANRLSRQALNAVSPRRDPVSRSPSETR